MRITNKQAFRKYQILEKVEAGIILTGAEIKSIRAKRANLDEAFARITDDEVFLVNAYINPWMGARIDERRPRKLLLHRNQILNWQGKIAGSHLALIPLAIYIKHNLAKVELGLAKNKTKFDKRAALKKKAINRDIERQLRGEKT